MRADVERAIREFSESEASGVFTRIAKADLINDIRATLSNPTREIGQGRTAFCGPASILHALAHRQPKRYVDISRELYESGTFLANKYRVSPSRDFLHTAAPPGISPADWILMGAMRDSENMIFPVESTSGPIAQGLTTPWEMKGWVNALLGCSDVEFTSTFVYGEFEAMRRAQSAIDAGGVAFLMVDAAMLGGAAPTVAIPNHWIEFLGELRIDDGTWWKHDSGRIHFECYSWSQKHVVDRGEGSFEDYMWGVVLGKHATVEPANPRLLVRVEPTRAHCMKPATFTVQAVSSFTGEPVNGQVTCAGKVVGEIGRPITTTIGGHWELRRSTAIEPPLYERRPLIYEYFVTNKLYTQAEGYPSAQVPLSIDGIPPRRVAE